MVTEGLGSAIQLPRFVILQKVSDDRRTTSILSNSTCTDDCAHRTTVTRNRQILSYASLREHRPQRNPPFTVTHSAAVLRIEFVSVISHRPNNA